MTIYEVAKAAGVSPSTVSRAFSRPGRVSVRTADRIRAVAAEMGYRDEPVFRPTLSTRHHTIGLAVADVTNPFYFGILRGAEAEANQSGYTMLLMDAQESVTHERNNLDRLLPLVDGLIVASTRMSDTVLRSAAKSHPLMVLNRHVGGLPSVTPDTAQGMKQAVSHLHALGHRAVTYLAGPDTSWISGMRWHAVRTAAAALGLTATRLGPAVPTVEGGVRATPAIIASRARAVICYNDLTAIGVMKALHHQGYQVPGDVSLIGCDNIFASDLVTPPLTTIAAPMGALGTTAVKHIIAMLGGARLGAAEPITIPVKLIIRESTGPAA